MPQETLRNHPLWRAEDLGKPIPDTKHAISMCLPRWQDVVGYEEKDPATMEKLKLGYPRFFYHPLVEQAFDQFRNEGEHVQIYATHKAAVRCREYLLHHHPYAKIELRDNLVSYPAACADDAKDYWQHAGEGISSRCAEALLNQEPLPDASTARNEIIDRLAEFTGAHKDDIYLFSCGMSAINAAFLAVQQIHPGRPTVQYAFPYGDTLKLQNKMGHKPALFYARGDAEDLQALETALHSTAVGGLFCEFPTNPLLTCIDLIKLRELANQHGFPIIIDETLGACINQNTLPLSDVSAISLTKFFSGTSDVMGGALIINPEAPFAKRFKAALEAIHEPEAFHPSDAIQLAEESRCCRERVEQINRNALAVCEFLNAHPAVESVYYPAFTDQEMYDRFRRPDGGYGGLFSFVLKEAEKHTEAFYDALEITKGPNLGTSFSLCCPFTLIAHYNELEWAETAGASRHLIRISVGLESSEELIARLTRALPKASN
ncbi:Cystathionine gamma-synthase [Pontiella desulfatans]|uniref:Cystathionine gamma-synthase n=1 Tax=Pontiella desulfatans TaxID=2750659 RepID=A0A6C2U5N9_PONDE|nr:PLP-dependent transferase [Pontiella desulfatans]VGO14716.1 Cystathionine gamma-synthase [Pontiella desulfatans]